MEQSGKFTRRNLVRKLIRGPLNEAELVEREVEAEVIVGHGNKQGTLH
jgi:hypothetical protein